MAVPKRRQSKTRGRKRRTHWKISGPQLETCLKTGVVHRRHRAYEVDGILYYKGEIIGQSK